MATPPTLFPKTSLFKNGESDSKAEASENKPGAQPAATGAAERPTSLYKPRQPSAFSGAGQNQPGSAFRTPAPAADAPASSPFRSAQSTPAAPQTGTRPFSTFRPAGQTPADRQSQTTSRSLAKPAARADGTARPSLLRQQTAEPQRPTLQPGSAFRPQGQTVPAFRATSPFRKDLQISDEEFVLLRDFIYLQCGIFIAENRKYLVENRLSNRIKELNLKSYNEYYNFLRFDANRRKELNKLFEVVTTNETSFFRNPPQLEVFQKSVLAETLEQCRKSGQKKLRIWSAGCSTGEEPYTLAIILHEVLKSDIRTWDIKITANDLSEAVLAAARRGVYNEYALRTTPKEIVSTYFGKEGNLYKVDPMLKRLISFGQINLSDKEQLRRVEKSQIVFCRNVIIYFDDEMKRKVINAFYDNLEPSGALLIGHSESLHNISRAFQLEHHKGTIVYRKLG
ncbi:hypothetical protein HMPREF0326_01379 [Desulfovibrio sp. 3_1_syn3]|nr:hypothetical protein HMPREF0326_01379 [Desulfovibrio sp. 3_1_syn3]